MISQRHVRTLKRTLVHLHSRPTCHIVRPEGLVPKVSENSTNGRIRAARRGRCRLSREFTPSAYRAPPLQSQSAGAQGKVGAGAQDYPPPASCRGLSGCGRRGRCRWLPGKASASTWLWGTCEEPRGKGSPSGGESMARGTASGMHGSSFPLGEPSAWSMGTRSLSCHTADALGHALPRPLPARD